MLGEEIPVYQYISTHDSKNGYFSTSFSRSKGTQDESLLQSFNQPNGDFGSLFMLNLSNKECCLDCILQTIGEKKLTIFNSWRNMKANGINCLLLSGKDFLFETQHKFSSKALKLRPKIHSFMNIFTEAFAETILPLQLESGG